MAAKWVAAQNAANRQPAAAKHAVHAKGFDRILRTRRLKTAVSAHEQAERALVEANEGDKRPDENAYSSALKGLWFASFLLHVLCSRSMACCMRD